MKNTIPERGQPGLAAVITAAPPATAANARFDLALLASVMFLGRFTIPFGHLFLDLTLVPVSFLLVYRFIRSGLVMQYDRLLWFLAVLACAGWSLWSHFNVTMLTSFFLFVVLYWLLTLARPTTGEQYRDVLQAYQLLVAILSAIAIVQFLAQFVVNGRELIHFFGIFPDYLFTDRQNTLIPVTQGSSLIKSNALFLPEPSTLSQVTALAILIEILEFRRAKYLSLFAGALLLSYSGTGLMALFAFMPVAAMRYRSVRLPVLIVVVVVALLAATGAINLSVFMGRLGEFQDQQASGFARFVSPIWLAQDFLHTAPLSAVLFGNGPGTTDAFAGSHWFTGFSETWLKLIYEYGLIGLFVFACFFASCFRKSHCPGLVRAAIVFGYVFLGGELLDPSQVTTIIVLCTLSAPVVVHDRAAAAQPWLTRGRIAAVPQWIYGLGPGSARPR
jgi:hypothetical protein